MRSPPKPLRYLLLLLFPIALMVAFLVYRASDSLPRSGSSPSAIVATDAPSTSTPAPTQTPTKLPLAHRITPNPTYPVVELQVSKTPSVIGLQQEVFQGVWETVRDTYLYPDYNGLDWEAVRTEYQARISTGVTQAEFYELISEMIESLGDDHSFFLTPEQVAQELADYQEGVKYSGIGVLITAVPERQRGVILGIFSGSPAEAAGLKPRDSILRANGESILNEDGTIKKIIRGVEGTEVTIEVQTPGETPRQITLTRRAINSHYPVPYSLLISPQGKRVGYILLLTLSDSTISEQFAEALEKLTEDGPLDGLILDNTQNGGGPDTVAKSILGYFTSGTLGYFISHEGERPLHIQSVEDIQGSSQVPLVILIGPYTASYGEVISGVLQDTQRAYLIGETTDGNVETLWGTDFADGSRLWLAHETFRPVNDPEANWEETGIIPDLEIPEQWDLFTVAEDPMVQAALDYFDGLQP